MLILVVASARQSAAQTAPAPTPLLSQEVFVTGSVTPSSLESLGRSVTVFTQEDIERLGLLSTIDVLRLAPGVDPRARGPRDVQTDFSIRGADFGQSLVLVDGLRLNDSQSGHHNGDIPIAVAGIDRVEIVNGAGSTVHGADALGGTINIITRTDRHATATFSGGQFGYAAAQTSFSGVVLPPKWTATAWGSRSGGFTFDRDFAIGGLAVRGQLAPGWTLDVRRQNKAFGANGFYGASPSKEWTDQTLASTSWLKTRGVWTTALRASWRNHGDHFRWDINRPGFAENRHRTNSSEIDGNVEREWASGQRLTMGATAGADWVRSDNLGNHDYGHQAGYAELFLPLAPRTTLQTGLRLDNYSTFGRSWSPSAAVSSRVAPSVKVRASVSHAFRIPTFTELYYHDPASLGSPDLRAERGWSVDGGVDWDVRGWTLSASPFARWDKDVIDWVRPTAADLWRATNVRDVTSRGVELSAVRRWKASLVKASYTGQSVDAPALASLSKYVRDYAKHSVGLSVAAPIARAFQIAGNLDHRVRPDGQRYWLVGTQVSRTVGRARLFLDATNLLNETYYEVTGVSMPGRWVTAGVALR
jgi:outer membrane cobalamin receptor